MVNFKSLGEKAKELIDKRGGTGALKDDAAELKDIASGQGSLTEKAKSAAEALKDPGADGGEPEAKATAAGPIKSAGTAREREGRGQRRGGGRRKQRGEGRRGPRDVA